MSDNEDAATYNSESSGDEEAKKPKERTRKNRKWVYRCQFESINEAKDWIGQEEVWSILKTHETDA